MAFPVDEIRARFPSLELARPFVFFDNAAGAQIPAEVIDAVTDHLRLRNVQRGGPYRQSREVDAAIGQARQNVARLLNARSADEVAFGLNATSFIRTISLAIGQTLEPRPHIIVTEIDHEANVAAWLALERAGARVLWWRVRDDGRLHTADLEPLLDERTRVVACAVASNAMGTLVDVAAVARLAHAVGAEVFLDAVHYAPHGPLDVQRLDCDYLVCSGYKLFAPHMGFVWCRREAINALPTFREHFIPDVTPDKLEAGTYAYENIAGMSAAVAYLERLGPSPMERISEYERGLSRAMLDALQSIDGVTVHGVTDRSRPGERVPTFAFTVAGMPAALVADGLAARHVGVRAGHMYSPRLLTRLGLLPEGVVRASLVHYNTIEEVGRFADALRDVVKQV